MECSYGWSGAEPVGKMPMFFRPGRGEGKRLTKDSAVSLGWTSFNLHDHGLRFASPVELITRHSSDIMAVDEPHIADALRRIRTEACQGLTVKDLIAELPLSRRGFEIAFHRCIGVTPGKEIARVRIGRAKSLLADTLLSLPEVAARCGFKTSSHFGEAFLRETGLRPGQYRKVGR